MIDGTSRTLSAQAVVLGGGPAGMTAALCLARKGVDTLLASAPHRPGGFDRDRRTAALFAGSIELLRNIGVWEACEPHSAALRAIRLIDDTGGLLRAPEVIFQAGEAGLDCFGYNVPNDILADALASALAREPGLRQLPCAAAREVRIGPSSASAVLTDGTTIEGAILAAADGRKSISREAAGISARTWAYPQSAVVTWFTHQRDHEGISTEFHRKSGPFTTVPMPGRVSSLVWVAEPAHADQLVQMGDDAFRREIETRLQGLLGAVGETGPRAMFPLSGLTPSAFAQNRVALVGESGHVIPPIGAQGLNLGLRDAATLADCVADALARGADPGGPETMAAYSNARAPDVQSRIYTVDLLNRSLISSLLPVQLARGAGLHLLRMAGPLRRRLIREGVQPSGVLPSLMRPGASASVVTACVS